MTEEEKARETLLLGLSNSLYKLISDLDLEPDVEVIPEESFDDLTREGLVIKQPHHIWGDYLSYIYGLANGVALSVVNPPELHNHEYFCEIAVCDSYTKDGVLKGGANIGDDKQFLDSEGKIRVFKTAASANEFIEEVRAWAETKEQDE